MAHGVAVQGDVTARLFGVTLLRLHADVVLAPADVRSTEENGFSAVPTDVEHVDGARSTSDRVERGTGDGTLTLQQAHLLLLDTDASLQRARAAD